LIFPYLHNDFAKRAIDNTACFAFFQTEGKVRKLFRNKVPARDLT
jgi:hypothetical protein